MRLKIEISYEGTDFHGWQRQSGERTVQEEVEKAFSIIFNTQIVVFGSGRTDQGVHARSQIAHADISQAENLDLKKLLRSLNALLPDDVRIISISKAEPKFHAQFDAAAKEYRYFIYNSETIPPYERRIRTHVIRPLDIEAMRKAASFLIGKHDFASFTANPNRNVETTVRELISINITKKAKLIEIKVIGTGFLYKMVRSIAGFLIKVGNGDENPQNTLTILNSKIRTARVPTAPPNGLFLWKVYYSLPKQISKKHKNDI